MRELTERQKKLEALVNEIDDTCGFGIGFVDGNTNVDKFIKDFIHQFTKVIRIPEFFDQVAEGSRKTYWERFHEI